MNKGALALLVHGGTENWSPQRWKIRFDEVCDGRRVLLLPGASFDPAEVHYAAVWKPHPGELAGFPNLRVIFNLGAGRGEAGARVPSNDRQGDGDRDVEWPESDDFDDDLPF